MRMNINMIQGWWGLNHVKWLHRYDPKKGESPFFAYWGYSNLLYFILNTGIFLISHLVWYVLAGVGWALGLGGKPAPIEATKKTN
mmetsp:Transcript_21751/g.38995  ORF Transcript_21751/g.38995 Transcript_21751/m.38995 type:complete len:85 (+) Transcript_21751:2-256(+)